MEKLKISELFYSIQGEGRYMGVPSIFLRTFGCNFTCGGFGMPKGTLSTERDTIAINAENYTDYKSLPLVSTGCDSYASWDSRFKHLSPVVTTDAIVITGGEPLLGWQRAYPELLSHSQMAPLKELTFETNGTQSLTDEFAHFLHNNWHHTKGYFSVTFSVSPKLSVSGEKWEDAIKPDVVAQLNEYGYTYLKFVIASEVDAKEALDAVSLYRKAGFDGPVYFMPVGGVESVYALNNRRVAELAMKYGLRYSDRLQVPLFKNEWGT